MARYVIDSIFMRKVTQGDFWHIERGLGTGPTGGGGQTYIDIPLGGGLPVVDLWAFLGVPAPSSETPWPAKTIRVTTIGDTSQTADVEFASRGERNSRYKISNQARQKPGNRRHPAWTSARGFPKAPDDISSSGDSRIPDVTNLKVFVVKTVDGKYYAGFVNSPSIPAGWPQGFGLEKLFDASISATVLKPDSTLTREVPKLVRRILNAWKSKPNVLLYGPPGTGKTYAMEYLWDVLSGDAPLEGLFLDSEDEDAPFKAEVIDLPFEQPVRREWVTFHQNYGYENFIVALRPNSSSGVLELKPRLGTLMDAAVSTDPSVMQPQELQYSTALIYIDEVNRGNVSRIFGEFITFMDADYRAGTGRALPVPLPSVGTANPGETESIERFGGPEVKLPVPWCFPPNVYTLAAMNSVDRAVAPLDTALARRFARIEVGPDMDLLAELLKIGDPEAVLTRWSGTQEGQEEAIVDVEEDAGEVEPPEEQVAEIEPTEPAVPDQTAGLPQEGETSSGLQHPSAAETAYLLLYRTNYELASTLGTDFELGHTYVMDVGKTGSEKDGFEVLARAWDQAIYPQLRERFANRPEELSRLLRLDRRSLPSPSRYLFKVRQRPSTASATTPAPGARDVLNVPSLEEAARENPGEVAFTLRYLAGYG